MKAFWHGTKSWFPGSSGAKANEMHIYWKKFIYGPRWLSWAMRPMGFLFQLLFHIFKFRSAFMFIIIFWITNQMSNQILDLLLLDYGKPKVEFLWILLLSEGKSYHVMWNIICLGNKTKKVDEIVHMMMYVSANLRPNDLKFGMHEAWTYNALCLTIYRLCILNQFFFQSNWHKW
jgi:hypothetical protein